MASSRPTTDADVRWLDEREQAAWRAFITGARRLTERLDQELKALGLGHDDYGVLVALSEADGDRLRMAELADLQVESRSRLSHHIGRLEARGLVARETCPEDRRGTWAVLTPEGRTMIESVAPHHVAGVRRHLLDHVEPDELDVLRRVFDRVNGALGPSGPGACPDLSGPPAPR
ncbi:MAG TPA: MarR family transcriptional regulator [Aquihabitans sp.]|nr:MarR family transcriptional regulator [Aquihabitans sp.]